MRDESSESRKVRAETILLYAILPAWAIAGFADWMAHRKTSIERTSGTHESMTHALMMMAVGVPAAAALLYEIDATVIAMSAAGALLHEAIVLWDVAYAAERRKVSTTEQHLHSFLEVLPGTSLALMIVLCPDAAAAFSKLLKKPLRFALQPKKKPLTPLALACTFGGLSALLGIPYAEEFLRCLRADRTLAPHRKHYKLIRMEH